MDYNCSDNKKDDYSDNQRLARLRALIIGINVYKSEKIKNLTGAVADAEEFHAYLKRKGGIEDNITKLLDGEATKDNILGAFTKLREDKEIKPEDPIVIYFAGHGSEVAITRAAGDGFERKSVVVPHDCETSEGAGVVHAIPHFTIGNELTKLAKTLNGRNITVILDSCNSTSATRGSDDDPDGTEVRSCRVSDIPDGIDGIKVEELAPTSSNDGNRAATAPESDQYFGLSCHVLLAACGREEKARERAGRGLFTLGLLRALEEYGINHTYAELIGRIKRIESQTPHCEGVYRSRYLFTTTISPSSSRPRFPILQDNDGRYYIGTDAKVAGISIGDVLQVFADKISESELGEVRVVDGPGFYLDRWPLNTSFTIPKDGHVRSKKVPEGLRLRCLPSEDMIDNVSYLSLIKKVQEKSELGLLDDMSPNLELVVTSKNLQFKVMDSPDLPLALANSSPDASQNFWVWSMTWLRSLLQSEPQTRTTPTPRSRTIHEIENEKENGMHDVPAILTVANTFFANLSRAPKFDFLRSKIEVELNVLKEMMIDGNVFRVKDYSIGSVPLQNGAIVTHSPDKNSLHGLTLTNTSEQDLFVSVYYYDTTEFTVIAWYEPPKPQYHKTKAPLEAGGGVLEIGHGFSGWPSREFSIAEKQDYEIGFIKIYITQEYADLSHLRIGESPFVTTSHLLDSEDFRGHTAFAPISNLWDCIRIEHRLEKRLD